MRKCKDWLRVIAAAHATGTDTRTEYGITIQRITGGNNNAIYPAVAYRWLSGEPLGASVTDEQLEAVLASVQLMHTLEPERNPRLADTWLHWFDFCRYLPELDEFIDQADTNLANAIWNDEGRVRWVDWEYSQASCERFSGSTPFKCSGGWTCTRVNESAASVIQ